MLAKSATIFFMGIILYYMILRLISNLLLSYIRFSRRVSRAFSFNKTPRKLTRAISGMVHGLSPFGRDPRHFDKGGVRKLASTFDLTVGSAALSLVANHSIMANSWKCLISLDILKIKI